MERKVYLEEWPKAENLAGLAGNIARHLQLRQNLGSAVIITERPAILLSAVRKQWIKLERTLLSERARTLDTTLRATFTQELERMNALRFVAAIPEKAKADVFFMAEHEITALPPTCRTFYLDSTASNHVGRFFDHLPEGSVVVQYSVQEK